jgi:hypothetical protein
MKKTIALLTILTALTLLTSLAASTINDEDTITVSVHIQEGWNLVSNGVFAQSELIDQTSEIKGEDILAMFYYNTEAKKYFQVYPNDEDDILGTSRGYTIIEQQVPATWIYSKRSGQLVFNTDDIFPVNERKIKAGWNFISLTPSLIENSENPDLTFDDIKGTCDILKAYYFFDGNWEEFTYPEMDSTLLGKGLAIKVTSDCHLSTSTEISAPPGIPSDVIDSKIPECTDTDGGKNYNVKGTTTGPQGENTVTKMDTCIDSNKVGEWFCWPSDNHVEGETYTCPNGCQNGACIE